MERESFESEEVAAIMNQKFVNIKVDREERPDVDKVYVRAAPQLEADSWHALVIGRFLGFHEGESDVCADDLYSGDVRRRRLADVGVPDAWSRAHPRWGSDPFDAKVRME